MWYFEEFAIFGIVALLLIVDVFACLYLYTGYKYFKECLDEKSITNDLIGAILEADHEDTSGDW